MMPRGRGSGAMVALDSAKLHQLLTPKEPPLPQQIQNNNIIQLWQLIFSQSHVKCE